MPRGTPQTALRAPRGKVRLAEVMKVAMRASRIGIRTAIPCTVETYDPILQTANVIAGHIMVINTDAGEREAEPMKVPGCPVRWLYSKSSGGLTLGLAPGDTGHLIISDRSLEQWRLKPPVVDAVDPAARHTHNIIDGIFEPGLHTTAEPIIGAATVGAVLEGTPTIKLGATAVLGVARLTDTVNFEPGMATWALAVETAINALAPGTFVPGVSDFATLASKAIPLGLGFGRIDGASTTVSSK